jgi:hypothetical protein
MTTKIPTSWIPQPVGYGYVNTVAAANLTTQLGVTLTTQLGAKLQTGTNQVVGKYTTIWSDTGA